MGMGGGNMRMPGGMVPGRGGPAVRNPNMQHIPPSGPMMRHQVKLNVLLYAQVLSSNNSVIVFIISIFLLRCLVKRSSQIKVSISWLF